MILRLLTALSILLLPTVSLAQDSAIPERRGIYFENTDLYGGDIRSLFDTTIGICENACLEDATCVALTFNQNKSACFLKSSVSERSSFDGALSVEIISATAQTLQTGNIRAVELDFLPEGYLSSATDRAQGIGARYRVNSSNTGIVYRRAQRLNDVDDFDSWMDLALAAGISTNSAGVARHNASVLARDAVINAYLRANTVNQQVFALIEMVAFLEASRDGRKTIPALRLALDLSPDTGLEERLDRAIGLFGFRITDHQVDNNAERPRICVNFNEPLVDVGVDYTTFISFDRGALPIVVEGEQLCIDGVQHGQSYGLLLRAGLPAANGEVLHKSVNMSVYVRDRDPSVHFLGRAYVLPRGENAAIPVVSVNTDTVEVKIHRIGDRGLTRIVDSGLLGSSLNGSGESEINNYLGEEIWSGIGDVGNDLNVDMTTALPLGTAIESFDPGVYVMTARVTNQGNSWENAATQWFIVTDLGVETLLGADGLHVFVRALSDAEPVFGVNARLLAVNNEILAEVTTDALGYAHFPVGYTTGTGGMAPAMVQLTGANGDFAYLNLQNAGFDLSDRGVEGRNAPPPIDIFLTTERGVYRPGETVYATILARDTAANALAGLPLTAIVDRPDGLEFTRALLPDQGAGGRAYHIDLPDSAMRGTWTLRLYADPDDVALQTTRFLVEDFVPERIDFDMTLPDTMVGLDDTPLLELSARYLYGAPAAGLKIEGEVEITRTRQLDSFPNYVFGLTDEPFIQGYQGISSAVETDAQGNAALHLTLPDMEPSTQPMEMRVTLRMSDGSGRPVERSKVRPLAPLGNSIGIKPLFDGELQEADLARFEVIAITPEMTRTDMTDVSWTLARISSSYQWYKIDGRWNWERITRRTRISEGTLALDTNSLGQIEVPVDWGRYELKITGTGANYTASSYSFYAGWWGADAGSDTPDILDVGLDAAQYAVGSTARLRLTPRYAGKVLVRVMSDHLIEMQAIDVTPGDSFVDLTVSADWGAGAYVTATLIRPMDVAAGRNPSRAIGLAYAPVDPGERAISATFDMPAEVAPRGPMEVVLNVENLGTGPAYATIAAVDLGILNLTAFESPDPQGHYFGQRKLGMEMRDLYGRLIDGMQGDLGALRSGGDGAMARANAPRKKQELVAYFSGPIEVAADGTARATFDMPEFNGTVRLMAVVWSQNGVGQAEQDVLVRDDVVLTTALPRFLAPGDQSRLLVELAHAKGPARDLSITIDTTGDIFVPIEDSRYNVLLDVQGKATLAIPIRAGAAGDGTITITMTDAISGQISKTEYVSIRANDPLIVQTHTIPLVANGGAFSLGREVFADMVAGSGTATLTLGPLAQFNAPALLDRLDRYPYGCTEQLASRALPLLYFGDVAQAMGLGDLDDTAERINDAITGILAHQSSRGSFGLWRPDRGDMWLDAYASDFLSRARTLGYDVPDQAFSQALENLSNQLNYAGDFEDAGQDIAYALMVLAREGKASIGDLRYYADIKSGDFATPLALAQLGAALAYYGDQARADTLFSLAYRDVQAGVESDLSFRVDYGSKLRDMAGLLALAVESGSTAVNIEALADRVGNDRRHYRSTQETMWTLLAANALIDDLQDSAITVNGTPITGPLVRRINDADLSGPPMLIRNAGDTAIDGVLTVMGVPSSDEPAQFDGYRIERWTYTFDGEPADLNAIQQNDRLVAIIRITPEQNRRGRLMVSDPLPAGFEIDNPNLLRAGDISSIDWLNLYQGAENTEFRDDRFLAAVDWSGTDSFQMAYIIRAISPGTFRQPAASVEDMYRPELRGRTGVGYVTVRGPQP